MRLSSVCLLLSTLHGTIIATTGELYSYTLLASAHIASQLAELPVNYPKLATLTTAQESFQLPSAGTDNDCTFYAGKGCPNYILTIQDSIVHPPGSPSSNALPEVFLSGAVHGNERVGPTAVLETAKILLDAAQCESLPHYTIPPDLNTEAGADYLLQIELGRECRKRLAESGIHDRQRKWLARLVATRRIVVVPMTNALGYDRNRREEDTIDPNRDFPYDVTSPSKCMQTIAGRTVNELFQRHLFQMSLTFHGGTEVVGYEWGAYPFLPTNISPDDIAQVEISGSYSRFSGNFKGTQQYKTGNMNDLVYAVHGGMEDWAYAGSWDPGRVTQCAPTTYGGYDEQKTVYNDSTLRAFNMLIETSNAKIPTTHLGNNKELLDDKSYENNGHVTRNIRLALMAIELVQPYLSIWGVNTVTLESDVIPMINRSERESCVESKSMRISPGQNETTIAWVVGGGFTVDYTNIMYAKWNDVPGGIGCMHQPMDTELGKVFQATPALNGVTKWKPGWTDKAPGIPPGWENPDQPMYQAIIDTSSFKPGDRIAVFATARLDQGWAKTRDGAQPANMPPTSHVVNARTNLEWTHESAGKIIQGRKYWFSIPLTLVIGEYSADIPIPAVDLSNRFDSSSSPKSGGSVYYEEAEEVRKNSTAGEPRDRDSNGPFPIGFIIAALSIACVVLVVKLGRRTRARKYGRGERVNVFDDDDSNDLFVSSFDKDEEIQLSELS